MSVAILNEVRRRQGRRRLVVDWLLCAVAGERARSEAERRGGAVAGSWSETAKGQIEAYGVAVNEAAGVACVLGRPAGEDGERWMGMDSAAVVWLNREVERRVLLGDWKRAGCAYADSGDGARVWVVVFAR